MKRVKFKISGESIKKIILVLFVLLFVVGCSSNNKNKHQDSIDTVKKNSDEIINVNDRQNPIQSLKK